MSSRNLHRVDEALLRAFVWAYVGAIFGSLFVALERLFTYLALDLGPVTPDIAAAALAGAVSALFYGSMRLAVLAATVGALSAFGFLSLVEPPVSPVIMAVTTGLSGLVLGGLYGHYVRDSRVFRADAKTLAGLVAGSSAALVLGLVHWWTGMLPLWVTTALLCSVTGLVYSTIVPWFVDRFHHLLPPVGDGILVGVSVSSFVGLAIWVVIGELHAQFTGLYTELARHLLERVPQAAGGAMLGASLGGFLSGIMGRAWQDL